MDQTNVKPSENPSKKKKPKFKKCVLCSKDIKTGHYGTITQHYLSTHLKIKLNCKTCKKSFKNANALSSHFWREPDHKSSYDCHLCPKTFEIGNKWTRHLIIDHLQVREFECDICETTYISKSSYELHMVGHQRKLTCKICNKDFKALTSLGDHMVCHKKCHNCGKEIVSASLLYSHLRRCI